VIGTTLGAYAWLDDVMAHSDTDIHYAVELCLTYTCTFSSYKARQRFRRHLITRYRGQV
jgi:hypothetical protein